MCILEEEVIHLETEVADLNEKLVHYTERVEDQSREIERLPKLANAKIEKPKYMRDTEGYVPSVGHYNLINILVCCDCGLQNSRRYITGAINT